MTRLPRQSAAGFTLIELMLTVSIAAILLAIGIPSFTDIIRNNRLTSAANDLQRSTQVARAEAVKRQVPVVVCASNDASLPRPTCSDGAFGQWFVFVDTDGDWVLDNTEPVLDRHTTTDRSVTVLNNGNGILSYAATGFATPPVSGGKVPTNRVVLCDKRGNQALGGAQYSAARALLVAATGRTRITRDVADIGAALGAVNGGCP